MIGRKRSKAALTIEFLWRQPFVPLGLDGEVDHQNGVLLHDAHQQHDADQRDHRQVIAEQHQRQECADAGRGQRGEDRERVDEALVQHTEHDVDDDGRGEYQPRLAGQRLGEFGGVAGIAAGHRTRHADVLLRRADQVDGVAQRIAGRQVEGDGDGWKLLLMGDHQRRRTIHETREGGERHLVAGGDRIGRGGGVGVGAADRRVGDRGRRAVRGGGAGDVDLGQRAGVLLVTRLRLQNDAILVGLAVDGRNLPLAVGVVERVGDALHGDAEASGLLAVDFDGDARAAFLRFRGDLPQRRIAAQPQREFIRPIPALRRNRCRPACTGTAPG